MKRGRPRSLRIKKTAKRKYGARARGARNPKQLAARMGRQRIRRTRGR